MACSAIWGRQCWTNQSKYTAIAALVNIPATIIGAGIQVLFLSDSARPLISVPPTVSAEPMTSTSMRQITRDQQAQKADIYERKV